MTSKAAARRSSRQHCGLHPYTPWEEMRQHASGEAFSAPSRKVRVSPEKSSENRCFFGLLATFSDAIFSNIC
jgi:hypothetical protein